MKRFITPILLVLAVLMNGSISAQTYSSHLKNRTIVDTARYRVIYKFTNRGSKEGTSAASDVRDVLIGKKISKDFSEIILHYDSLATMYFNHETRLPQIEQKVLPCEIINNFPTGKITMKYRLPNKLGTLSWTDEKMNYNWNIISGDTTNILGYRCNKALITFKGRKYVGWFTTDIPISGGPYKFAGLPGLILKVEDSDHIFTWEAIGFYNTKVPIFIDKDEKERICSRKDALKTIKRVVEDPGGFVLQIDYPMMTIRKNQAYSNKTDQSNRFVQIEIE